MKSYKNLMLYIAPVIFAAHSLFVGPVAFGQEDKKAQQPVATPSPEKKAVFTVKDLPSQKPEPTPVSIPETPRERRALAYAKLLEAQRLSYSLQRMNNPASEARLVISARAALMMAIQLEPKLSEAYTLLAELTVNYPPRDWEDAARLCQSAIQTNRDSLGGHQLLSRIYIIKSGLKQGRLDQQTVELAIKELREVVRLNSSSAEGWALLSEFYRRTGQRDEEVEALKNWADAPAPLEAEAGFYRFITEKNLSTDMASASLGQALMRDGKKAEAIAAISRAIYLNPDEEGYIQLLIDAFDEAGNDDSAIMEVKRLVATNPTNFNLLRLLASIQSHTGKFDDAVATLKNGLARVSKDDETNNDGLRMLLAEIYTVSFHEKEAIAAYEDLLKTKKIETGLIDDFAAKRLAIEVFSQIIALQKNLGQFKEAEQTIARMRATLGKDDSYANKENIKLLRNQGKYAEALQQIRVLRQNAPSNLNYLITEAQVLSDLERVDEGVALLRSKLPGPNGNQSTISFEDELNLYLNISALYTDAKRGKEAVDASQQALSLVTQQKPTLIPNVFYFLASAQEQAGDHKGAEDSLRKILKINPDDPAALNNLGYFFVERNERLDEALEMIRRAVRLEPTNSSYLDSLGWAYFKLGKLEEAERYLYEASRRDPFSAAIQNHLGDVYNKLGKIEPARTAWQRALKLTTPKDEQVKIKAKLNGKTTGKK